MWKQGPPAGISLKDVSCVPSGFRWNIYIVPPSGQSSGVARNKVCAECCVDGSPWAIKNCHQVFAGKAEEEEKEEEEEEGRRGSGEEEE